MSGELPKEYKSCIEFTIADDNENVVIRNLFTLLIAYKAIDEQKAAMAMVHLNYSFALPPNVWGDITRAILPSLEDFYQSVKHKKPDMKVSNSWKFGKQTIRATMARKHWKRAIEILRPKVPMSFDQAAASRKAVVLSVDNKVHRQLKLWNMPSIFRISDIRFRETGILLPFGHPVSEYTQPNL
jgi:hypothetical protein